MKKIFTKEIFFVIVAMVIIVLAIFSIRGNNAHFYSADKRDSLRQVELTEKQKRNAAINKRADSIVTLSFKGIELGSPLSKTIKKATKKGDIYNVTHEYTNEIYKSISVVTCNASINVPSREYPLRVNVKITAHLDTITTIEVKVLENYSSSLRKLYTDKYDIYYANEDKNEESWGNGTTRLISNSLIWKFKNQVVNYTEYKREERELYIKNAQMQAPQNRYGVKYYEHFERITITYTDIEYTKKAKEYQEQEREYKLREKKKIDSLKYIERLNKSKNQDI